VKRVGILGGTFNPVHIGHLAIAQTAADKMDLEKVIFVPCNIPPHKNPGHVASARDRYNMVRLAIKGNALFALSDFEIKKPGTSYTIDTLRYFQGIYRSDAKLFFVIGGDTLTQLKKWRFIGDVLKIATFIVVNRPGRFRKTSNIPHCSVSMPGIDISSSYVRQCIVQGRTIKYFVPENVSGYIQKKKLYQNEPPRERVGWPDKEKSRDG